MAFLTHAFVDFFRELALNNHKEWFDANRKRYEKEVKAPFYALVQELIDRIGEDDPTVNLPVKDTVFRINRDIRFSKDKTLYKTHVAAVISARGRKNMQIPGLYFHISADDLMIGGGMYKPEKAQLYLIREAIARKPKKVTQLLKAEGFNRLFGGIQGEKNKVLPAEFKPILARQPLIANKQFYYMAKYQGREQVLREDLVEFILEHYQAGKAWNQFLLEASRIQSVLA